MANIFHIKRADNEVIIGTSTTIMNPLGRVIIGQLVGGSNALLEIDNSPAIYGGAYYPVALRSDGAYFDLIKASTNVTATRFAAYNNGISWHHAGLYIRGSADNVINMRLRGRASQTVDFFQITDSALDPKVCIDKDYKITAGSFGNPLDVTATRQYGMEFHYSGNNYDVTGLRSRARLKTTDTTATAQGALLQAANEDGINAGVLQGALIEAIGKSDANAATITVMRACLVNTEWGDYDTVTNLKTLHVRTHSRNAVGAGSFGTGYGVYIENEAVGGNGQAYDAGIYFKGTNLSAGNKAFTHGIDFSGGTFASEEIKLANGSVVGSDKVTLAPTTNSTTFFQVKNAAGTIVGNFDTTNIRFGVGTASPSLKFDVKGTANTSYANCPLLMQVHTLDAYAIGMGGGISLGGEYGSVNTTTFGYIAGLKENANEGDYAGKLVFGTRVDGAGGADFTRMTILSSGNVGIGVINPTARLHLAAGTTAAGTAPLKFTSGTDLTTPEAGVIEYDGTRFYMTGTAARRAVSRGSDSIITPETVHTSAVETTVFTASLPADSIAAGKVYEIFGYGKASTHDASATLTVRLKINGTTLVTLGEKPGAAADDPLHYRLTFTARTIGGMGTISSHGDIRIKDTAEHANISSTVIDTTGVVDVIVTFQWDASHASNTATLDQGFMKLNN